MPLARYSQAGRLVLRAQLALAAGDRPLALTQLQALEHIPETAPLPAVHDELKGALSAEGPAAATLAREWSSTLGSGPGRELLALGTWAEGARLAAAIKDAAYFLSPAFRSEARRLGRMELPREATELVVQIATLAAGEPTEEEFRAISRKTRDLDRLF